MLFEPMALVFGVMTWNRSEDAAALYNSVATISLYTGTELLEVSIELIDQPYSITRHK